MNDQHLLSPRRIADAVTRYFTHRKQQKNPGLLWCLRFHNRYGVWARVAFRSLTRVRS